MDDFTWGGPTSGHFVIFLVLHMLSNKALLRDVFLIHEAGFASILINGIFLIFFAVPVMSLQVRG